MTSAPLGWHTTQRLVDGRNLVRSTAERRLLARTVLELGEDRGLFLFGVPDTHLHTATCCDREVAGVLAQVVACALSRALHLPVAFEAARFTPINDQAHLRSTVSYILGNAVRHGNHSDPLCEGTNLPDLLGLRITGRYTAKRVASLLPRLQRQSLLIHLPVDELAPGREPGLLAEAAAASVALPSLRSRGTIQRDANVAAVHIAQRLGCSITVTAQFLGLSARCVSRYRLLQPRPELVRAIELQLGLRELAAHRADGPLVRESAAYDAHRAPVDPRRALLLV